MSEAISGLFRIGRPGRPIWDRQEIPWTIWGPSVPHIGSRPIERNHRRSCSTSRIAWDAIHAAITARFDPRKPLFSRLRNDQRWGVIGHSKVQVISCRSLSPENRTRLLSVPVLTDTLMTADPRTCPESKSLTSISLEIRTGRS